MATGTILTEQQEGNRIVSSIAMVMTLVSFSMLFATMFLGYAVYRGTSEMWPPMGMESISLLYPSISTALIILSSIFLFVFEKTYFIGGKGRSWLLTSILFGLFFVGSQFQLWAHLKSTGVYVNTGIFASIIYGFTWIHAAHMVIALVMLFWLLPAVNESKDYTRFIVRVQNVSKFWHFLGIVWLIMYMTLFVI